MAERRSRTSRDYQEEAPEYNAARLAGRVPPQNLDAEASILGAVLIDTEGFLKIADQLSSDDFYMPEHQMIYAAMQGLFEKRTPIDLVTLRDELDSRKELDIAGGASKLASLAAGVLTSSNISHYATIVRQKALLRRLISAAGKIGELGFKEELDTDVVLDEAERALFGVTQKHLKQNFVSVRSVLDESFERLGMLAKGDGKLRGIPTQFRYLDKLLGGLQRSDLLIIAARPAMGKCVVEGTRILDPLTGEQTAIEDLVASQEATIATLGLDWRLKAAQPSQYVDNGLKPAFEVKTALGKTVSTTAVHPFLTVGGWKRLEELRPGDRIAVPRELPFFGQRQLPESEVALAAYYIADGGVTQSVPGFTNVNPAIVSDFLSHIGKYDGLSVRIEHGSTGAPTYYVAKSATYGEGEKLVWHEAFMQVLAKQGAQLRQAVRAAGLSISTINNWQMGTQPAMATALRVQQVFGDFPLPTVTEENPVTALLRSLDIWGKSAVQKSVPKVVFTLEKAQISLFINRLFACDGTAYVANSGGRDFPVVAYGSVSKQLVEDIQHLLLRFGILSKVRQRKAAYNGTRRIAYELEVHGSEDIRRFALEIGILGKEEALSRVVAATSHVKGWTKDTVPKEVWARILQVKGNRTWRSIYEEMGKPLSHNIHAGKRAPRRETVAELARVLGDRELHQLATSQVYWDTITEITPLGLKHVYDLTVPESHNFIANDFVVHNTTFAMNIAENVARSGSTVGVFSLEMSKEQLVDRLVSSIGRVDAWKLRSGELNEEDLHNLIQAQAELAEARLFIDDGGMATVTEVRAKARRLQSEHGLDLIVIDYLQLMSGGGKQNSDNRVQEVSEISRGLKALAKELNVPIIALSQLSRAVEARTDKRPMLSDLRESGSIEQDADVVMFLYREDYYNKVKEEHNHLVDVIISKHRNGPTGDVRLSSQLQFSRFYDLELGRNQGAQH